MSQKRAIWNDGQGLATPDLQRPCDAVGTVDDRVLEVYNTPGSVQKKVMPTTEESATVNTKQLAVPSTPALTPAGTNGAVRVLPCQLIAGAPSGSDAAQRVSLAATLYSPLDSAQITSNSSGGVRYDLVYATIQRSVTTTGTRKIKSATDGTLSSQTINLEDAPAVTLGVNVGFLTGATPPTTAQINAAVPADTAPSPSTFGAFNFPVAYVTVANGYSSGTVLQQNSSGGTTYITQCWPGGWVVPQRIRGTRTASIYASGATEKITGAAPASDRWGSFGRLCVTAKLFNSTTTPGVTLDSNIDWRRRFVTVNIRYVGSASNSLESGSLEVAGATSGSGSFYAGSGGFSAQSSVSMTYNAAASVSKVFIDASGNLKIFTNGTVVDNVNGDLHIVTVEFTDQFVLGL